MLSAARLGLSHPVAGREVPVARRPRVALLVTGDELVRRASRSVSARSTTAIAYSLGGLLEGIGIVPQPVAHVRDDVGALRVALLVAAASCEVVITSGGVSAGEADHIPRLIDELGRVYFWKVRMKPGMPFLCGEIGKALVFALPGNPVSSLATFLTLVKPGLMSMQGADEIGRCWYARLAAPVRKSTIGSNSCARGSNAAKTASCVRRRWQGRAPACCAASPRQIVSSSSKKTRASLLRAMSWNCSRCRDYAERMSTILKDAAANGDGSIREIDPAEALARRRHSALLIDVREDEERGDRYARRRDCSRARGNTCAHPRDRRRSGAGDIDDLREWPPLAAGRKDVA